MIVVRFDWYKRGEQIRCLCLVSGRSGREKSGVFEVFVGNVREALRESLYLGPEKAAGARFGARGLEDRVRRVAAQSGLTRRYRQLSLRDKERARAGRGAGVALAEGGFKASCASIGVTAIEGTDAESGQRTGSRPGLTGGWRV